MDTDELIKIEETKANDMPSRFQLYYRFQAMLSLVICHISNYMLQYSTAFFLIFYLLDITFDSALFHLLIFISVCVFIYNYQDCLVFQPNVPADSRYFVDVPSNFGLPYEDLFLQTKDGLKIHAYLIRQPSPASNNAFTIIYLHGNAGNMGHRLVNISHLYQNCRVNILSVDYRGFGRSQGLPSEGGFVTDATTAYEYLLTQPNINHGKIIVFGRSLGGAVAISTALALSAPGQLAGMIVENTFTSIVEMGRAVFKLFLIEYVPGIFVKNKFESIKKISDINVPSMFISGQQDEFVPPVMMRTLYEKSRSPMKRLLLCPIGTHNESWRCNGYYDEIVRFLTEVEEFRQGKELPPTKIIISSST